METAPQRREGDPVQAELYQAIRKIGKPAMENELLSKRCEAKESLRQRRPREMTDAISTSTGKPYADGEELLRMGGVASGSPSTPSKRCGEEVFWQIERASHLRQGVREPGGGRAGGI